MCVYVYVYIYDYKIIINALYQRKGRDPEGDTRILKLNLKI